LSVVVTLSRQLNTLLSPEEQLLAYCRSMVSICPWIHEICVAFLRPERTLAEGVLTFDAATSTLREEALEDRNAVRAMVEKVVGGKKQKGRPRKRSAKTGGVPLLEDLFFPGESNGTHEAKGVSAAEGPEDRSGLVLNLRGSLPLQTRSGTEGWVLFLGSEEAPGPLAGEEQDVLSVCTDILAANLERMSLFQKVLRAKKEWERSVDAIRDVVMIIAPDCTVQRGNRRLADLSGVPVETLKGMKCHGLLASGDHGCPSCPAGDTVRTLREATAEVPRPDQETVFQVWCYPILDASGALESVAVYEKDITEIKQMQEQLVLNEKMAVLGQMAAAVAHEINNPLSGVISLSKILLGEMDPGLPYVEDLKNIEHAALRCKKIVQDLLVFSRKHETEGHDPVSLESVMERVHGILRPNLEEKGVRMDWTIPVDIPLFPYHPDPLQQILMNLVSNARDAMSEGGRVRICAERRERKGKDCLLLTVMDSGEGIHPDQFEKIFEPFYTTKGPGEGTGLGLSICQRLMESFGGRMEVSSAPGKGTEISLWFPMPTGSPPGTGVP